VPVADNERCADPAFRPHRRSRVLPAEIRTPVVGRSLAGVIALIFAVPLSRHAGLTTDPRTARRVGTGLAVCDFGGVIGVLQASTTSNRRRAARINALLDVALAAALCGLGQRRRGRERTVALLTSASVWVGALAWHAAAQRLRT
jgi:hypothetical protein